MDALKTLLVLAAAVGVATPTIAQQATEATKAANAAVLNLLPFIDKTDFQSARRGFIATLDDPVIKTEDGALAYDTSLYSLMDGEPPKPRTPASGGRAV